MPVFDFNPADAISGLPVYPKGSYQIELGEPKSFYKKTDKEGKIDNYGVRFRAKIAEGEFRNKPIIVTCYMHNDDSKNFSKAVQMAALGYTPRKEDDLFNTEHGADDWRFNTDDASAGDGWHGMKGQVLIVDLDTKTGESGDLEQKTIGYRPLKSESTT